MTGVQTCALPILGGDKLILVKNSNYYGKDTLGNQLPFLDSVEIVLLGSKQAEIEAFKNKNIDVVIGLPSESIKEIVIEQIADFQNNPPKYILDRSPEMNTQYYRSEEHTSELQSH